MIRTLSVVAAAAALAGCQLADVPEKPERRDLRQEQVRERGDGPPVRPYGACWAKHVTPAIIDTVTEQVVVAPATVAADGTAVPAAYRTVTQQKIVQDRTDVWFQIPCPPDVTPEFIASLQRALKARGLYLLPLSGQLDAPTLAAIRRYQVARGLDSDTLALASARELGLIAADRAKL